MRLITILFVFFLISSNVYPNQSKEDTSAFYNSLYTGMSDVCENFPAKPKHRNDIINFLSKEEVGLKLGIHSNKAMIGKLFDESPANAGTAWGASYVALIGKKKACLFISVLLTKPPAETVIFLSQLGINIDWSPNKSRMHESESSFVETKTSNRPLKMSHDAFLKRIKNRKTSKNIKINIKPKSETKHDDGSITRIVILNNYGFVMTDSNSKNQLTFVSFMGAGDGSIKSGAQLYLMITSVLDAIEKKFSSKQAIMFLQNELDIGELKMDGESHEAVKHKVFYSIKKDSNIGIILQISREAIKQ